MKCILSPSHYLAKGGGLPVKMLMSDCLRLLRLLSVVLLMLLLCGGAAADDSRWKGLVDPIFDRIDGRDLPHPLVTAVAQDKEGFLWIGTQGGLARYDGYRFLSFLPAPNKLDSLPEGSIETLYLDWQDRLWLGTAGNSGLVLYDRDQNRFRTWRRDPAGRTGPRNGRLFVIRQIDNDHLLLGGNAGLDQFDSVAGTFMPIPLGSANAVQPAVHDLIDDGAGNVWAATADGLFLRRAGQAAFQRQDVPDLLVAGQNSPAFSLGLDSAGNLWVGGRDVLVMLGADGHVQGTYRHSAGDPDGIVPGDKQAILEVSPGIVWVGSYSTGLNIIDVRQRRVRMISAEPGNVSALASGGIHAMAMDRSGLVWIANSEGGLVRVRPQADAIMTLSAAGARRVSPQNAMAVTADKTGRLWIGNREGELTVLDASRDRRERLVPHSLGTPIRSFVELPDGQMLLGGPTLCLVSQDRYQSRCLPETQGLKGATVTAFARRDGIIWVGTTNGLYKWPALDAPLEPVAPGLLSSNHIWHLRFDRSGHLWIGMREGSIDRFEPTTGKIDHFIHDPDNPASIAPGFKSSILQDSQGRIWVGAIGGPLSILTERPDGDMDIRHIGRADGMPHENVGAMAEDGQGRIWASTAKGLAVIDPHSLKARALGPADGVSINNYWAGSVAEVADGTLFFGGVGGVTLVRPAAWQPRAFTPPVVITSLRLAGKNGPETLSRPPPDGFTLSPGQREFAAEFAALDMAAPELNRYAYRLDGFDAGWTETTAANRVAAYTNLPPGNYVLRVRGTNGSGDWSPVEVALRVRVEPLWYETGSFMVVLAVAGLAAVGLLLHGRTHYLRRRQVELQKEVEARTAELQMSADTLHALSTIGQEATRRFDADAKVAGALHRHVNTLLHAPSFCIFRVDRNSGTLIQTFGVEDDRPFTRDPIPLSSTKSMAARAAREKIEVHQVWSPGDNMPPQAPGTRVMYTVLFAPLIVDDQVLGVLSIQSDRQHAYGERERRIFRTLCAYATIALANIEALEALRISAETLDTLGEVGQEITRHLDPVAVAQALHRHVGSMLHAPAFHIYRMDPDGTSITRIFGLEDGAPIPARSIPLDSPISNSARAARDKTEVLNEIEPGEVDPALIPGTRAMNTMLFAPLIVDERVLGVMTIQSDRYRAYGERERRIFRTLCAYGAIALANVEALEALRRTQGELVQREKLASLGQLVAGVAHEVNTPLGVAVTAASTLSSEQQMAATAYADRKLSRTELERFLERVGTGAGLITANLGRAAELIRSFKQVAADQTNDDRRRVDLRAYLDDILRSLAPMLKQAGVDASVSGPEGLTLSTLPGPLAQVVTNLVQNAVLHAFDGVAAPQITVSVAAGAARGFTISVVDNGTGMPPDVRERAFDPFFTTRRGSGGTGLGLHIVHNLVTGPLGGSILLDSAPGVGTRFTIQLAKNGESV